MVFVIAAFLFALPQANDSSIAYRVPAKLTPDYGLLVDVTIVNVAPARSFANLILVETAFWYSIA